MPRGRASARAGRHGVMWQGHVTCGVCVFDVLYLCALLACAVVRLSLLAHAPAPAGPKPKRGLNCVFTCLNTVIIIFYIINTKKCPRMIYSAECSPTV